MVDGSGQQVSVDSGARTVRRVLVASVATLWWAVLLNYLLSLSTFLGRSQSADMGTEAPFLAPLAADALLAGTLLVWLVVVWCWALLGSVRSACAVTLLVTLFLGGANMLKLQRRGDPLSLADVDFLRSPGFLLSMVSGSVLAAVLVTVLVVPVLVWWLLGRLRPRSRRERSRRTVVVRLATVVALGAVLWSAVGFNQPDNTWRRVFDADVTRWMHWSQHDNFMRNGFVAGALYDMPSAPMTAPPGYGRTRVEEVVARYRDPDLVQGPRRRASPAGINVVSVLSESFSDPSRMAGVDPARDPIRHVREVMRSTASGELLVGGYGGGTANVEFEVLTGLSTSNLSHLPRVPLQQDVPRRDHFPSFVQWFRDLGHHTVAIHPFGAENYRRAQAYPRLGFDTFRSAEDLDAAPGPGPYVSDATVYADVLDQLRSHDEAVFAHVVTMQNHLPYLDEYEPLPVSGLGDDSSDEVAAYLGALELSDAATADFLAGLEALDEPTAVVFYGDHLPGIYPPETIRRTDPLTRTETPWFIWTNLAPGSGQAGTLTSPGFLVPLLLEHLDARGPGLAVLLDAVRAQVPALQPGHFVTPSGEVVEDPADLAPAARRVLEDYALIQYDLMSGEEWSEPTMTGQAEP